MISSAEQVEVRVEPVAEATHSAGVEDAAPTMFVRAGRLYVVRRVLSRWSDRGGRWRVEASPGRGLGTATYDLVRHPDTSTTRGATWTLRCVAD